MIVVTSIETYAQSSDPTAVQHQVTRYDYQAGFYDGDEKQFRGFSHVEKTSDGDDYGLTSHQVLTYDTGAGDDRAQMAGLLLHETADDDDGPQSDATSSWELCSVSDIPATGLDFPIRFVCKTSDEIIHQEGAPEAQWVTTRAEYEYDGSGNQTTSANLGVTKVGGGGCAPCQRDASVFGQPCGPQCLGDEAYDETDFIAPQKVRGAWMLNLEREQRSYGRPGSDVVATSRTFYDGVSFVGLGQDASDPVHATLGLVTRTAIQRVVGGPFETVTRNAYDDDGNVSDTVAARGDVDGEAFHTRYTYDSDHLEVESETKGIESAAGDYSLKRVYEYDALFGGVARATAWFIVGEPPPADSSELWSYDQFGRLEKNAAAGDTLAAPSSTYTYEYGNPVTRIVSRNSVTSGGTPELERIECLDGFGRELQSATKVADDTYLVQGAQRLNRNGLPNRVFEAFTTDGARACDAPAATVVFDELFYDSTGRERRVVRGDGPERGGVASLVERRFGPLETTVLDEDDNDADSPTRDTPLVLRSDGLGRTVTVERLLDRDGASQVYTITYDELGNMRGRVDPAGNETVQTWDLSGRLLSISDPDRGTTTLSYDADDNAVRVVDANGTVTVRQYDALDRLTAEFDEADEAGTRVDSYYDRHPVCLPSTCTNAAGKFVGSRYPLGALGEGLDSLGYDARERLIYRSRQLGQARFDFSTSYDNAGRVVRASYPGDVQLEYRYDVASRVVEIPGSIDLVTYDDQGRFQEIQYANGLVDSRRYGRLGELVHVDTSGRNGDPLVSLDYSYNRQRDLRQIVDASAGAPGFLDASFGYDALRRLSSAGVGRQAAAGFEQQSYQYDLLDNIVAKTSSLGSDSSEHVGALAYGPEHPRAVTTSGATALAYDPAGRTISRGRQTFEYDFRARLRTVAKDNAPLARYFYATAQSRVLSVVGGQTTYELSPNLEVRDGVLRLRFGAGAEATVEVQSDAVMAQVFPTAAADGVVNAADAFATGLAGADDDANAVLAGSARRLLLGPTGRQTSWMVVDHQGSTVAVADGQGTVTERIAYQPFGAVRASTAGRTEYASFTGRDLDDETGFIDFAARSYSPTEGRFLTPDDAFSRFRDDHITEMTDATGTYSYCSDNPANFVDPTGNISEWATRKKNDIYNPSLSLWVIKPTNMESLKLNLVDAADLFVEPYEVAQKLARWAGGMFRAAIDKRKEAAAKRQGIAASASKGVDPAGAVATAASASLGQGQTVRGGSQPKGRLARLEARLKVIARDGSDIGIEQKLRDVIRKREMKAKSKAGRRAVRANWAKANPRLAAQKGAAPGTRARR
jgi:RHS repeat-associated protein